MTAQYKNTAFQQCPENKHTAIIHTIYIYKSLIPHFIQLSQFLISSVGISPCGVQLRDVNGDQKQFYKRLWRSHVPIEDPSQRLLTNSPEQSQAYI